MMSLKVRVLDSLSGVKSVEKGMEISVVLLYCKGKFDVSVPVLMKFYCTYSAAVK